MAYPLAQQQAQLAADHPLEASVAASAVASEVLLLRLASGLRWAGDLRPALALSRVTWGGAETELVGARAAWQGMRAGPLRESILQAGFRGITDYGAQASANLLTGDSDPYRNINVLETGMSAFGLRPAVIGFGSAAVNLNSRGFLKTVFHTDHDHRVYPGSFFGQALLGTGIGRGGLWLESRLLEQGSRSAAVGLYMQVVLRQPRLAYPLGIGLYQLGTKGIPALIGVVEETSEGTADNILTPKAPIPPDSTRTQ